MDESGQDDGSHLQVGLATLRQGGHGGGTKDTRRDQPDMEPRINAQLERVNGDVAAGGFTKWERVLFACMSKVGSTDQTYIKKGTSHLTDSMSSTIQHGLLVRCVCMGPCKPLKLVI